MKKKSVVPALLILLAGCGGGGGGGDDNPAPGPVAAAPTPAPSPAAGTPAVTPTPANPQTLAPAPVAAPTPAGSPAATPVAPPPPVVSAPIAAPAPVVEAVNPNPAAPPPVEIGPPPAAGAPPAVPVVLPPPVAAPQPAEGTYILGSIVKAAILDQAYNEFVTEEIDPKTGNPVPNGLRVTVNFYTSTNQYTQYSYPSNNQTPGSNAKFPYGSASFPVGFSDAGWLSLGRLVTGYSYVYAGSSSSQKQTVMVRQGGDFEIKDDFKFIIDSTAAEWRGTELDPNAFIQLQVGSYPLSNTAFMLCQHQSFGDVRRRACTIHNKDTGRRRGSYVIDDSRNLGPIEYLPVQ